MWFLAGPILAGLTCLYKTCDTMVSSATKAGYNAASREYEEKFKKQAEAFYSKEKDVERNREEYEALLDQYEMCIEELKQELAYCKSDRDRLIDELNTLRSDYERLKALAA